jgi:nucleoside-diphosphate-sugar epimerase
MEKINLIGGSGFIGTRLAKRFICSGLNFNLVDKKQSLSYPELTVISDVRNFNELANTIDGSIIVNLAAEHRDDVNPKTLYDQVNVDGARIICDVAEAKGIKKIIFTSSVAVYGFAPIGTDESGAINFFNDYGRTKYEAEQVYKNWQSKDPKNRSLVIVRPTVVFGEQNRGNVYNLFKQIASGRFLMVGKGLNVKSMAYVENVASFLEFTLNFGPGIHLYNYVDKPDFDMNTLVGKINNTLGRKYNKNFKIPFFIGYLIGIFFDFIAMITNKKLPISSIRIKKFCSDSSFNTTIDNTGFIRPCTLEEGLRSTVKYEFLDKKSEEVFYSE